MQVKLRPKPFIGHLSEMTVSSHCRTSFQLSMHFFTLSAYSWPSSPQRSEPERVIRSAACRITPHINIFLDFDPSSFKHGLPLTKQTLRQAVADIENNTGVSKPPVDKY